MYCCLYSASLHSSNEGRGGEGSFSYTRFSLAEFGGQLSSRMGDSGMLFVAECHGHDAPLMKFSVFHSRHVGCPLVFRNAGVRASGPLLFCYFIVFSK